MRGLKDKILIVAGGGSGIGAATARRLAEEGAILAIGDIVETAAQQVAASIVGAGGRATGHAFDIASEASVADLIKATVDLHGQLDGLHVNAADMRALREDTDASDISFDIFDRTITVNMRGHLICTKQAMPHLLKSHGALVYTTSEAAYVGEPTRVSYAMSKSGINALMRHVASRWGREGVRANAVAPGFTLTEEIDAQLPQDARETFFTQVRSARLVSPEDIAATVAFLLSDDAMSINGQVISVDGGRLMRA
ncbi:SDR family NAD(P)-dependent oxidoreductase [Sphingomonas sp. KC8]|uniref:SDR family NAD(P)-dependent oxidoreductase n=1 Tax=Sphingomonas sp. KC8 TaxID=1030157 RepID=UPI00049772D4|nr:SDR family oxidoreductase [Sphingomonas sp. KC8]ARS28264.1 hypothetical protein KC8_13355 [Sphingomonas sp. KC8]